MEPRWGVLDQSLKHVPNSIVCRFHNALQPYYFIYALRLAGMVLAHTSSPSNTAGIHGKLAAQIAAWVGLTMKEFSISKLTHSTICAA
jgi:hypothetical protein